MTRFADYFDSRPSAQLALAWFGYRTGELAIADEAISRAFALRPGWEEAALLKFSHLREQGDEEATTAYAIAFLEEFPDRSRFRLTYGRLLAEWNDNIAALAQSEALLKYESANIDALYAAGVLSQNLADPVSARGHFETILAAYPQEDRARLYLGQLLSEDGETENALDLLGEVADPDLYFDAQIRIDLCSLTQTVSKKRLIIFPTSPPSLRMTRCVCISPVSRCCGKAIRQRPRWSCSTPR